MPSLFFQKSNKGKERDKSTLWVESLREFDSHSLKEEQLVDSNMGQKRR